MVPRTNSSTRRCHVSGSPMIAGAHPRKVGNVRGTVHYRTILPRTDSFLEPPLCDARRTLLLHTLMIRSVLTSGFYSTNVLNI
jgi:hypothetical protein